MGREVIFEFDPFEIAGEEPNPKTKKEVLAEVRDYVVEQVLTHVAAQKSPVDGYGKFDPLSPEYKKRKIAEGHPGKADLLFSGDMLDALKGKARSSTVEIGIRGKQGEKADGHCNFSGDSELPLRRFIPNEDDGDVWNAAITKGIKRIVRAGRADDAD